ncbi:hypothetical protein [Symbiopectobacterium sp.]
MIEDSTFYAVLLAMGSNAWVIHPTPVFTLEDALDIIADRLGLFA